MHHISIKLKIIISMSLALSISCDEIDIEKQFQINSPKLYWFNNFSVIMVDPNGKCVNARWKGYNQNHSNFIQVAGRRFALNAMGKSMW